MEVIKDDIKKYWNRIRDKLQKSEPIYMTLPDKSIFKMDRPVPFIVIYRSVEAEKEAFTTKLAKTESSYIIAHGRCNDIINDLVDRISGYLSDLFSSFLIVELWLNSGEGAAFTIHINQKSAVEVARKIDEEFSKINIPGYEKKSAIKRTENYLDPPNRCALLSSEKMKKSSIVYMGLEIAPFYINQATGQPYPLFLRETLGRYSTALRKGFYEFIRIRTSYDAGNFQMLGTTAINSLAKEIDREMAAYTKLFDFLLLVTPVNVDEAWRDFSKANFQTEPVFHYRPMPVDPELIKRKLYNLPIEDINDPTLAFLFRDKRKEIDRMLNMLQERERHDFLLSSLQVFGPVDEDLLNVAKTILLVVPHQPAKKTPEKISAIEFSKLAQEELDWLRLQDDSVSTDVRVSDDVEGILVSKGVLNISAGFEVSKERAIPLLQHEVGTHVVTYYNGRAQPLELFSIGVPGYEELQEGLAVLAEYLCDGLTNNRVRTLAARVVAVNEMTNGHRFVETFHLLSTKYLIPKKTAFNITMRVYRGGGLTKDAVYLKGLLGLIDYIKEGKDLKQLLIGKIKVEYLPVVQELIYRKILKEAPITPRYLSDKYLKKLDAIKKDGNIFNMLKQC